MRSLNDLARLVCSLERVPVPIFMYSFKNNVILAAPLDSLNGRSIIYYVEITSSEKSEFLSYKINKSVEDAHLVDGMKDTSAIYSPIIKISSPPESFLKPSRIGTAMRYTSVGLQDLSSISKLVAFRTIYEENTIPLYLFPAASKVKTTQSLGEENSGFVIGTPMNMLDSTDVSYFYYVTIGKNIASSFLKFSMQKSMEATFSNHPDEHGFVYLKIIQLSDPHPLVDI